MLIQSKKVVPSLKRPAPRHGTGIVNGNPKRCLICKHEIKQGESWTKHTSPIDPQLGSYSAIVHDRCNGAR